MSSLLTFDIFGISVPPSKIYLLINDTGPPFALDNSGKFEIDVHLHKYLLINDNVTFAHMPTNK